MVESDRHCPWCGGEEIQVYKRMPDPRGLGIVAYLLFPIALVMWLTSTTFNICPKCGGRWQRGVLVQAKPAEDAAPEVRAGMYAAPVPAAALVRRRTRLEPTAPESSAGEIEIRTPEGSCRVCRAASGRYDAHNAPPLPIPGCNCQGGCRCEAVPAQ